MLFDRIRDGLTDFFEQADLLLLGLCCTASIYGMFLIYSATRYAGGNRSVFMQGVAMGLGILAYVLTAQIDLEALFRRWPVLAAFNFIIIALLLTPLGIGGEEMGNTAWLRFPGIPVSIGPAEIVKITFIILLAGQMAWLREERHDLKSIFAAVTVAGHTLLLMGFYVAISGDMGNGIVFFFIFVCMAFAAGFALRWFILMFGLVGGLAVAAWRLDLIPLYQRERFIVVFDHSYDPLGRGWQQTRSMLALGSGGLFGQGYMQGTQTQSLSQESLPWRHTDFIFSVCGEELGLVGCLAVMLLLLAIIVRILLVARNAVTPFYCNICVGVAAMLMFQTIINIGMCLFVMPVIGITLPFFSYGGSSLLTLFAAMGLVAGIKMRSTTTIRRPPPNILR